MGNNLRRLSFAGGNKIPEFTVIGLHVGLAGPDFLALDPKIPEIEDYLALFRKLVFGSRIFWDEYAYDPIPPVALTDLTRLFIVMFGTS